MSVKGHPRPNMRSMSPQAPMTNFGLSMSKDREDQDSPRFIAHAPVATLPEPDIDDCSVELRVVTVATVILARILSKQPYLAG